MDMSILQPGDFVLFQGKAFISRGIRAFSNSKWSHVAMFIGNGYVIEATAAGVEKNKIEPLFTHADRVAVMRIRDLSVENMELMKDKAYSMIGDKYDIWQLLTFGIYFAFRRLGITWSFLIGDKAGAVVCSAFCGMCALVIPLKMAKSVKTLTPESFYQCADMWLVKEEELK